MRERNIGKLKINIRDTVLQSAIFFACAGTGTGTQSTSPTFEAEPTHSDCLYIILVIGDFLWKNVVFQSINESIDE